MFFFKNLCPVRILTTAFLAVSLLFTACEQLGGILRDEDAAIKTLSVDRGTLSPAFSASHFEYSVTVRNDVDSITVTATANSGKASVNGAGTKTLDVGSINIPVVISAESGASKTYTITVKRLDASVIGIETAEEMAKIGIDDDYPLEGDYILMNDITLENWSPIGKGHSSTGVGAFSGKFDGNGHTITLNSFDDQPVGSIYVYSTLGTTTPANPSTYHNVFLGIFGAVKGTQAEKAEIKNLKVHATVNTNPNEAQGSAAGLVAGYGEHAVFDNMTLSGTFTSSSGLGYAAGVVAITRSEGTIIKNCTSSVKMDINPKLGQFIYGIANSFSYIGGIVGYMEDKVGIENCHTSGDVKAISTVSGSQVIAGGILGGTYYAFSSSYHGWITDCSSTGNITVGAMSFWPMAGGITGVICGGHGTLENSTRIVRSYATGTIENASTSTSNWPYIGGIVGYVYFGAWVSQSYFDGTVISEKANDYTGGIAGYSSYATANEGVPCVIEDCWSAGKVRGRNNAGGIVGQNQANTVLKRSYSRAAISIINGGNNSAAQWGTGGIAGSNHSAWQTAPWGNAMTGNVALNSSISAPKTYNALGEIHRIVGRLATTAAMGTNYALPSLVPVADDNSYSADKGIDKTDGEDIPTASLSGGKPNQAFYEGIGWDFTNVWKMGTDGYPKLKWQE
jgi:hypothetical protein